MDISKLFDLPAHPLLVHAPVVLLPLAALASLLVALRPSLRRHYGWPTVVLAGVAAFSSVLAASSGEALQESVKRTAALHNHTELGDAMKIIGLLFFFAVLALMITDRFLVQNAETDGAIIARSPLLMALSALTVVLAILSTVWIVRVGHSGAKATWQNVKVRSGG